MTVMATAALRKRAVKMYLDVGDAREVASVFKPYSHQTIINWVREAGMPVKSRGWPSLSHDRDVTIFQYYIKGNSERQTAMRFDVARHTVVRAIRRMLAFIEGRLDA